MQTKKKKKDLSGKNLTSMLDRT